jgi:flagellar hook-basal body complex protein FliE
MGIYSISSVASAMRAASTTAAGSASAAPKAAAPSAMDSFGQTMNNAVQNLNQSQLQADSMMQKLATGDSVDIAQVMMTAEKANLSMQFAVQVRNKVVESYQEIMRMQV